MTNEVKHLFVSLVALHLSFLAILVHIFCAILLGCLLLLSVEKSLCMLDINPLSDKRFTDIFPKSVTCLSILFWRVVIIFMKSRLSIFSFMCRVLDVKSKKSKARLQVSSVFLLKFLVLGVHLSLWSILSYFCV